MKIYTKTGDDGSTGLFGGDRLLKAEPRVHAYGEVDELNSVLGLVRAVVQDEEIGSVLQQVQHGLFNLGAELACVPGSTALNRLSLIEETAVAELEQCIDRFEHHLPPLRQFILPAGQLSAAHLHVARTVCRRAERALVQLHQESPLRPAVLRYLNRLSDLLFVMARLANQRSGTADVAWQG